MDQRGCTGYNNVLSLPLPLADLFDATFHCRNLPANHQLMLLSTNQIPSKARTQSHHPFPVRPKLVGNFGPLSPSGTFARSLLGLVRSNYLGGCFGSSRKETLLANSAHYKLDCTSRSMHHQRETVSLSLGVAASVILRHGFHRPICHMMTKAQPSPANVVSHTRDL